MDLIMLRTKKNITQQELADSIGITRQMISAIENGAKPSVPTAKKIAKVLNFDWSLFYEKEST